MGAGRSCRTITAQYIVMTRTDNEITEIQAFRQAYSNLVASQADVQWLQPIRDRAIRSFASRGFPTIREEDWKYTNLEDVAARSAIYLETVAAHADTDAVTGQLQQLTEKLSGHMFVFANGIYREDLSRVPRQIAGLSVETLGNADETTRGRIHAQLGKYADIERIQLAALNTAFLTDGLFIHIEDGAKLSDPIYAVFLSDEQKLSTQPRVLVSLGEHSQAELVEYHIGLGAGITNAVTEIVCAEGAHLDYIKVQEESDEAYHLASQHVSLGRNSRFDAVHLDLGGRLTRNDLSVRLEGAGSDASLHGLFMADGNQHVDNHTRLDHLAERTTSRESYRGIMDGRGRGVFNGKIIVHPGAVHTDAQLNNRNLLLTNTAEVDTKPELEIYTDEVKCSHGATTGQLDRDALFYLQARGVPRDTARQILITAFAREIVERIQTADLLGHVERILDKKLPG